MARSMACPDCYARLASTMHGQWTAAAWRVTAASRTFKPAKRCLSTQTANDFDFSAIRASMLSRPPKYMYDYMVPTSSHLLNTALSDHIPPSHQPEAYQTSTVLPPPSDELPLPQAHHLVYFPLQNPASRLAPDGADLDHAPGGPFERRMWAGGSIRFPAASRRSQSLQLNGQRAVCVESIEDVSLKNGLIYGKEKVFVDVWRRYYQVAPSPAASIEQARQLAQIEERRTLVFMRSDGKKPPSREAAAGPAWRTKSVRKDPDVSFSLTPDPFLLFHFSALTYNAHFIHYDPTWAKEREGYKDLLVHGPLSLTLMFTALRPLLSAPGARPAVIETLEYRNIAPLYSNEKIKICAAANGEADENGRRKWDVWVERPDGGRAVKGKAESVLEG